MNTEHVSTSAHRTPPSSDHADNADHTDHSRKSDDTRRGDDAKKFRKIMKRGDRWGLLQKQPRGEQSGQDAAGEGFSGQHHDEHGDGSLTAGMFALQQAQVTLHQSMVQPTTATMTSMAPALAELISRHVKQLLVPDASSRHTRSREIMITLKDDILPGTELWLSRTAEGWRLRADTRSPDAYRMLTEQAPDLVERFASHHLGQLEIDPTLID